MCTLKIRVSGFSGRSHGGIGRLGDVRAWDVHQASRKMVWCRRGRRAGAASPSQCRVSLVSALAFQLFEGARQRNLPFGAAPSAEYLNRWEWNGNTHAECGLGRGEGLVFVRVCF